MTDTTPASMPDSTSAPASYAIAPEDQHIADSIVAMDPVNDVPGASNTTGVLRNTKGLIRANLPPEARKAVDAQLAALPFDQRADREGELVAAAMRPLLIAARAMGGMGEDATPYHREMATIEQEYQRAKRRADEVVEQIGEVSHYLTSIDPVTGEAKPVPVYAAQGERQRALFNEFEALSHRMRLLTDPEGKWGPEGKRRMERALWEAVEARKAVAAQRAERQEVERRAVDINRERRINAQAEQLASFRRAELS